MKTRKWWTWVLLLASFALILQVSLTARAQDDGQGQSPNPDPNQTPNQSPNQSPDQDQSQDPPGRVARLSFSEGSISFRPAGEDDWVTGVPNRPMVTGDDLWADEDSRAEVHVGSAAILLGPKTGITFLALDDHTTQIRLAQGSLILRVRHVDDDDNYEIDTPNIAFSLLQPGEYRVDVSEDGSQSITTVWHGRGRVTGGGDTYTVVANQSATFSGGDHLDYQVAQLPDPDDLDSWAFELDNSEDRADSANYVSREMTGYEDLDEYGDWSYVAGYGPCWRPRAVVLGWAPYRFGHWIYVGRWGWTWVEDEPWGFAPFHYGRWALVNNGWFWVPGPVVVRPIWAPALVAFVGGGPGFRFSAGLGLGWFPLAPGEVYLPGYRVSRAYVNNVNLTNTSVTVTKITNVYNTEFVNRGTTVYHIPYVNQHVANGVTVVSHDAFVNARPVAQNLMKVDSRELAAAPVTRVVTTEPIRASVTGAGRPSSARPPAAVMSRQVVAVRTPPAPLQSIEQRQAQAGGHLNQRALVRPVGAAPPAQTNIGGRLTPTTTPTKDGFRPFTQPSSGNNQVRQLPQTQPRTYEQQGTPEPENVQRPDSANAQSANRPASEGTHPLVRPAPPVQQRSPQQEQQQEQKFNQWHEQRPAAPPPSRPAPPAPRASEPKPQSPSKKGR